MKTNICKFHVNDINTLPTDGSIDLAMLESPNKWPFAGQGLADFQPIMFVGGTYTGSVVVDAAFVNYQLPTGWIRIEVGQ
jgi:hypothetical protein